VLLNAPAGGILVFLLWDVFSAAWEPVDNALVAAHQGSGGLAPALGYGALFTAGLATGLLSPSSGSARHADGLHLPG